MDITKTILDYLKKTQPSAKREYLGASIIGKECYRHIWYSYHLLPISIEPETKITFDIGHKLESLIIDYLENAGFNLVRPSKENNFLECKDEDINSFQGHMDGLLMVGDEMPVVLEIKTCKNSHFQRFKQVGLQAWSNTYYAQVQSYMGMTGFLKAILIAINKDTSELHSEWVDYDDIFYNELKQKALTISKMDEPPERINKSPLYYLCARCQFKEICFNEK